MGVGTVREEGGSRERGIEGAREWGDGVCCDTVYSIVSTGVVIDCYTGGYLTL